MQIVDDPYALVARSNMELYVQSLVRGEVQAYSVDAHSVDAPVESCADIATGVFNTLSMEGGNTFGKFESGVRTCIVFVMSKREAEDVSRALRSVISNSALNCTVLLAHHDSREGLTQFASSDELVVLVCTSVGAEGVNALNCALVIHINTWSIVQMVQGLHRAGRFKQNNARHFLFVCNCASSKFKIGLNDTDLLTSSHEQAVSFFASRVEQANQIADLTHGPKSMYRYAANSRYCRASFLQWVFRSPHNSLFPTSPDEISSCGKCDICLMSLSSAERGDDVLSRHDDESFGSVPLSM